MFFALAALLLAFTACTSENDMIDTSKKEVKVTVNMDKPTFGDDSRAARQGWEDGDQVVVVLGDYFGAFIHLGYNGYLGEWTAVYAKYNGESFDAIPNRNELEFIGNLQTKLGDSGNLKAIYLI